VTGYTDEELTEKQALEFFSEKDVDAVSAAIEEVFETGNTRIEVDALTKDGRMLPYGSVAARLQDPDGNQVLAGIGRDVSERRRLEQDLRTEKEHFRVALENSPSSRSGRIRTSATRGSATRNVTSGITG